MSRFKEYIVERTVNMTFELALKVFGMKADQIGDKIALKRKYRQLAMENHPDRGGSTEAAQDINDAYAVLSKASAKTIQSNFTMQDWKERQKKEQAMAESLKQALLSDFHPEIYQSYFNKLSGFNFSYEITKSRYGSPSFEVEFFTKDRDSVFTIKIGADILDIIYNKGLGSGEEYSYKVHTEAFGFHLKKKQKMSQRDWGTTRDHSFLSKPEILFPEKKMKEIFSGKTSNRAFSKRDMETYLKIKLGADLERENAWMPLDDNKEYYFLFYRITFQRVPYWGGNGIYQKKGKIYGTQSKILQSAIFTFPETEETAKIFEKVQKEVKKVNGDAKAKKANELLKYAYEAYKKSKGM